VYVKIIASQRWHVFETVYRSVVGNVARRNRKLGLCGNCGNCSYGLRRLAVKKMNTRMWANAQRDGRPANIGGALCSTPQSMADANTVPCSNAPKTRNPLKFARVLQTRQQISAANGQKFTILGGHVGRCCCLTGFSDCQYVPWFRRYSPTNLCDGTQMAIFGDFFASCIFSEPRATGFRPAS